VLNSPIVAETAPLLVQACAQVGAVQIRNMGTLGGNVANAAACADSLPALVCLDAAARLLSPAGEKIMPLAELVVKPNQTLIPPGAADSRRSSKHKTFTTSIAICKIKYHSGNNMPSDHSNRRAH